MNENETDYLMDIEPEILSLKNKIQKFLPDCDISWWCHEEIHIKIEVIDVDFLWIDTGSFLNFISKIYTKTNNLNKINILEKLLESEEKLLDYLDYYLGYIQLEYQKKFGFDYPGMDSENIEFVVQKKIRVYRDILKENLLLNEAIPEVAPTPKKSNKI